MGSRVPNIASERVFSSLGGNARKVSSNLDVQTVERIRKLPIPKDELIFTDEDMGAAKLEWGNTLLGTVLGASLSLVVM